MRGATANYENLGIGMRGPHLILTAGGILSLIGLARLASRRIGDYGRTGMAGLGLLVASAGVELVIASKNVPPRACLTMRRWLCSMRAGCSCRRTVPGS